MGDLSEKLLIEREAVIASAIRGIHYGTAGSAVVESDVEQIMELVADYALAYADSRPALKRVLCGNCGQRYNSPEQDALHGLTWCSPYRPATKETGNG